MKNFFKIKNKCGMDLSQTEELFHDLGGFAQERFGFKRPPTLHLVSDHENASKPLGKTAYYDPQSMSITIYTDNRHTKDILRSLAHELVHHTQNENGMLNDSGYHGVGYAQKNKDLRQSEKEAYLKGNMCFRDWEDGLKQRKPTIYNEWRIKTMSTKKWKNNELMENLSEKFGFKMNLAQLNESSCGGKRKNEANLKEEVKEYSEDEANKKFKKITKDGPGDMSIGHMENGDTEMFKMKDKKDSKEDAEEVEEDLDKLKGGLKDYMKKKAGEKDSKEKPKEDKKEMKESRIMKIIKQEIRKQLKERN